MIEGGISQRLINFCMSLVKDRPGGLAIVTIIASMFFAAISGSGPATVACIGGIMIPQMIRAGYSKEFSTAAAAAGGALGPIIPPSILFCCMEWRQTHRLQSCFWQEPFRESFWV